MSNHPITPLAFAQVNHDHLRIDRGRPERFPDTAAAIARLFARAHIVLAAIRAERRL
jgi:hypothetical protein